MDARDDTELMRLVCGGRPDLVGLLFDRHHRPVFGFFMNLTHQPAISEDLTQEVFLRVLRYASSFKPGFPFRPWLYQIARNSLSDYWGKQRQEAPIEALAEVADPRPDALEFTKCQSDQEQLTRALAKLPADKRELLLLSREPELSNRDLAELYGCTPAALKVRVHRAMNELRTLFFNLQEVTP